MKRIAGVLAVTSLLLVSATVFGAPKPPTTSGYKAVVADVGISGVPYRLMSDGGGAYTFGFTGPGDLSIDSGLGKKRPTRAHVLDFSEVAFSSFGGTTFPLPLQGVVSAPTLVIVGCGTQRSIDMQAIATGSSVLCPVWFAFDSGGANYRIGFNSASDHVPADWTQGDDARVTCTAGAGGNCSAWRIESWKPATSAMYGGSPDLNPKNLGILFDRNTNGILGYYYFSFRIDATE